MKRRVLCTCDILLILSTLLLATCGLAPTVTSVAVVPTASPTAAQSVTPVTPVAPTRTFTATSTSTATSTPTLTPSPMPTSTPSRTPTNAATQTATATRPIGLSVLKVRGTGFVEDNKIVRLTGAAANHFFWNNISWANFGQFREDVGLLHSWGANFVVVDWNSGFLDDPNYVSNLVEGLEFARGLGWIPGGYLRSGGLPRDIVSRFASAFLGGTRRRAAARCSYGITNRVVNM